MKYLIFGLTLSLCGSSVFAKELVAKTFGNATLVMTTEVEKDSKPQFYYEITLAGSPAKALYNRLTQVTANEDETGFVHKSPDASNDWECTKITLSNSITCTQFVRGLDTSKDQEAYDQKFGDKEKDE